MLNRRDFLTITLALGASGPALAQSLGVSGRYQVDGRNPDGSAYSGVARVLQLGDEVRITWEIAGRQFEGRGVVEGDRITVDWGDTTPVIYTILGDGTLSGTWAGGQAIDVLTPIP